MKKMILFMGLVLFFNGYIVDAMNPQAGATAEDLQREYLKRMQEMARQFQEQLQREREAHAQEMAAEREKRSETEKAKAQLEREKILRGILLHISVEDKTLIRITANDILQLDILERHVKTDEVYQRFLPYCELFGRRDLGVVATQKDLSDVREYISETLVNVPDAKAPREKPVLHCTTNKWGGWGGDVEWKNGRHCGGDHGAWVNPVLVVWLNEMGESNFPTWWWNKYAPSWPGQQLTAAVGRAMVTYNDRLTVYNEQQAKYKSQIEHAQAIPFPSDGFNRLVDQVNKFLTEGAQDAL